MAGNDLAGNRLTDVLGYLLMEPDAESTLWTFRNLDFLLPTPGDQLLGVGSFCRIAELRDALSISHSCRVLTEPSYARPAMIPVTPVLPVRVTLNTRMILTVRAVRIRDVGYPITSPGWTGRRVGP